jgi:DNA primase
MARIPDEQIERLKQEVSLVRLVESQGYKPKRQGKDYVIRCPFHEDDTPSLVISPANNLYHC